MTVVYRASTDHVAPSSPPSRARGGLPVCSSSWLPLHAASTRNFLYCPTTTDTDSGAEIQRRFVDATSMSLRPLRVGVFGANSNAAPVVAWVVEPTASSSLPPLAPAPSLPAIHMPTLFIRPSSTPHRPTF